MRVVERCVLRAALVNLTGNGLVLRPLNSLVWWEVSTLGLYSFGLILQEQIKDIIIIVEIPSSLRRASLRGCACPSNRSQCACDCVPEKACEENPSSRQNPENERGERGRAVGSEREQTAHTSCNVNPLIDRRWSNKRHHHHREAHAAGRFFQWTC